MVSMHDPLRWSVATFELAIVLFSITVSAQFYMYTPGDSIEPYVNTVFDAYGGGYRCTPAQAGEPCYLSPYFDSTLCKNEPANVSMTPWIESKYLYGSAADTGVIRIRCGTGTQPNVYNDVLVFTANGTLPDIHSEPLLGPASSTAAYDVPFSPANPFPVVVARCIEPGKLPSRIAYARRINWVTTVNGSYCPGHDVRITYHELGLPRCDPTLMGDACDGQTIVAMPPGKTSPSSPPKTSSSSSTTSVLSPASAASGVSPLVWSARLVHVICTLLGFGELILLL
jgi:hypothetical protein